MLVEKRLKTENRRKSGCVFVNSGRYFFSIETELVLRNDLDSGVLLLLSEISATNSYIQFLVIISKRF